MKRAVIVQPHDSFDKRFAIEASRIQYKHPQQKSLKKSFQMQGNLVLQMTGPVSGGDGKYYKLIEYDWNNQIWWVPADDVKEYIPEGGRNKTAPDRFCPDEKKKPNHMGEKQEKLIHPSVVTKSIDIKKKGSGKELAEFSLTYKALRGLTKDNIPILDQVLGGTVTNTFPYGYLSMLLSRSRGFGEEEQKKPRHIKMERKKCQEKGCAKQAHSHTNFTYCSIHSKSSRKVCVVCKKAKSRRKGGLCDTCFGDKGKGFCINCTSNGFKRVPQKIGGLCTVCINNQVVVIKKCTKCNIRAQRHKGGICRKCFKK